MVGHVVFGIAGHDADEVPNPEKCRVVRPSGLDGEVGRRWAVFRVLRYRL